jgi:hypothetical protein
MATYDEQLTNFIFEEMNKVNEKVQFSGDYLYYQDKSDGYLQIYNQEGMVVTAIDAIPLTFVNYIGEIQPIPGLKQIKYTIPIQILIPVTRINEVVAVIDTFQDTWRGKSTSIGVFNTTLNFTPLDTTAAPRTHNGKKLIPVIFTLFSNGVNVAILNGNSFTFSIREKGIGSFQTLNVLSSAITTAKVTNDLQTFNIETSKATITGATWQVNMSTYLVYTNAIELTILKEIITATAPKEYELKIVYTKPDETELLNFTKDVTIITSTNPIELGANSVQTIVFKEF